MTLVKAVNLPLSITCQHSLGLIVLFSFCITFSSLLGFFWCSPLSNNAVFRNIYKCPGRLSPGSLFIQSYIITFWFYYIVIRE